MLDWGTFSPGEYRERAIHLPGHPDHAAFLDALIDPRLADPIVYLSNLTDLMHSRLQRNAGQSMLLWVASSSI